MKIVTVVGARPQFIKAAIVSRALIEHTDVKQCLVHTGQHYDQRLSQIFFDEMGIPKPSHQLNVGSGRHGQQTGIMLEKLEQVLLDEGPDAVLVYGDTNSTLAGALAAVKLHIPIVHVEAGLRSFNRRMPEEINRVLTDHVSTLLICPTDEAVKNLNKEGIEDGVHLVGDVMYDCTSCFSDLAKSLVDPISQFKVERRGYILFTCHRAENTDDPKRLENIMRAVCVVAEKMPIVFPVHPRTRAGLQSLDVRLHNNLKIVEPVSYFEMLLLEREAALIITDSGGVQKEAFFCGVPCVTIRDETEWVETVDAGVNRLAGADTGRIVEAVNTQLNRTEPLPDPGPYYGRGKAAKNTAELVAKLDKRS